ncbi:DNA-binding protein RFX7 [Takifugu rubripes]|uniref:Regulatory factor X7a n=1 Tax=Takifugu rubripes TaxID=31033 RepID=A0A674NG95_TAKRU|nr:DNA-binding protein RFX7 [Takifugu rubripes]XP_029701815.1 DNA-binding protein RFX7 [Takifugu rubripes]
MDEDAQPQPQPQQPEPERGERSVAGLLPGLQGAEASALQLRIKNSICKSVHSKVENILQDIEKFSDIEKLYLYLKLPSGPGSSVEKSDQGALSSSRTQQMHAFSWIHNHLEEYPETSLPKQEVYDEYKSFCDNLNYHPLSAADFGKMMKNVFPNMKARRLGMRGKSKYCYSGLRKRPFVQMPSLPSLDFCKKGEDCDVSEAPGQLSNIKEDVQFAACDLVCEWAQKVLKRQFDAVEDLARFLIDSHYISNKSLAALTITASTASDVNASQSVSAFVPAAEVHSFQPNVSILSSPSVDAKQQLQRKIQRRQQEQKLHSPPPGEGQMKKADDGAPCTSPAPQSPQPTIGIMVAAVPSPITVQQNAAQFISSSPGGMAENKMLPINIQMVTQPVQALKQGPPSAQNILCSPSAERSARQRYAQILPKPSATTAIALRSPSTMIIGNSPIKTVMTTCHVSPVSLVKMTPVSLALSSSCSTTSLSNSSLLSASAGISIPAGGQDIGHNQNMRSNSAAPILAPVARPGQAAEPHAVDVEMEVEAIHKNSQARSQSSLILAQEALTSRAGGAVQRASSVPIPHTRGFLSVEELSSTSCNETSFSNTNSLAAAGSSNSSVGNASTLQLFPSNQNSNSLPLPNTERSALLEEQNCFISKGLLSTKTLRKRSGVSPDLSPVKRVYMPLQAAEGAVDFGSGVWNLPKAGAPVRPESAPASREVEMKMNLISPPNAHALCTSSFRASGFYSVAKTQSSMQRKNTSTVMKTSSSCSHPLQAHTMTKVHALPSNPGLQTHPGDSDALRSKSATEKPEAPQQTYTQPGSAAEHFFNHGPSSHQLPGPSDTDYFQFDDDVTQDSIVEELVQMEEQMKLNLQEFGGCVPFPGHQPVMQSNKMAAHQNMTAYYQTASRHSNPIQTPTPTPTPTSDMMGGSRGLAGESPCSHMASTTPVDSALGSSRHTPVGTPHSNCSSTVPPSPVECRNPFAFTPINSSVTGLHDGSTVSNSPVKPMQRPMATHPDKTRLEWMNNNYNSSGNLNKSNGGMGILPGYQGLIGDHFQKPHAFAVPHARHYDNHFGRLTPISPVQQQVASMANLSKQEGFAVPAPLDNKAINAPSMTSRCRSVSPAVHQRNLGGNAGGLPYVPRSVLSPFNSPVTPEMLSIFANSQTNAGVPGAAQRSHSVPLNVMMQTEVLPSPRQQCSSETLSDVLLRKLEGELTDTVQGLGVSHLPSCYTARLNLTQVLESEPGLSGGESRLGLTAPDSGSHKLQRTSYLLENVMNDRMVVSAGDRSALSAPAEPHRQARSMLLSLSAQQHPQVDFSCTMKDLLIDNSLMASDQHMDQSGLTVGGADVSCEIGMKSELPSSISDLNAMDTNLLFDPNQQQQFQNVAAEQLVSDHLFQQTASEVAHSAGLDWLESKDHPAVGLMG